MKPHLSADVTRSVPQLAECVRDLGARLEVLELGRPVARLDPRVRSIVKDRGTDDAKATPGAIPDARRMAHSSRRRSERAAAAGEAELAAEELARAERYTRRADAMEAGLPIPDADQTDSERLESRLRELALASLRVHEALDAFEAPAAAGDESAAEAVALEAEAAAPTDPAPALLEEDRSPGRLPVGVDVSSFRAEAEPAPVVVIPEAS